MYDFNKPTIIDMANAFTIKSFEVYKGASDEVYISYNDTTPILEYAIKKSHQKYEV